MEETVIPKAHRMWMSDTELNFLIDRLKESDWSCQEMLPIYKKEKKRHRNDVMWLKPDSEYQKYSEAYRQIHMRHLCNKDFIERFEAVMRGGRPRTKGNIDMIMQWSHLDAMKLEAKEEAEEKAQEEKRQDAEAKKVQEANEEAERVENEKYWAAREEELAKAQQGKPQEPEKELHAKDFMVNEYEAEDE